MNTLTITPDNINDLKRGDMVVVRWAFGAAQTATVTRVSTDTVRVRHHGAKSRKPYDIAVTPDGFRFVDFDGTHRRDTGAGTITKCL